MWSEIEERRQDTNDFTKGVGVRLTPTDDVTNVDTRLAEIGTLTGEMRKNDGDGTRLLRVRSLVIPKRMSDPSAWVSVYLGQTPEAMSSEMLAGPAHRIGGNFEPARVEQRLRDGQGSDYTDVTNKYAVKVADLLDRAGLLGELVEHARPKIVGDDNCHALGSW